MNLTSFDIFDTILIRKCGLPGNIFYLTAVKLFGKDSAKINHFVFWRKQAENRAIAGLKNKAVTIVDIYSSFEADYFGVDVSAAIEAEKKTESENLSVNPEILKMLGKRRTKGQAICFISDMYLDSSFLREVLKREGCIKEGEAVYVSCEHKASKHDGSLYNIVEELLKPSRWIHYGDNEHSDVRMAMKQGIVGRLVDTSFTDTEKKVISHFKLNNDSWVVSVIIGWLRWVRISMNNTPATEIASNFISPLYISYVQYIFKTAKEKGIENLYFLNRDSYILYNIAKNIGCKDVNIDYLFVSRRSLVLPAISGLSDENFLDVFDGKTLVRKTVDGILSFIKTSRIELESYGLIFDFNKITSPDQEKEVLDKLLRSNFSPILKERIREEEELLREYFKQEKVIGDKRGAFVDVGWLGTSRLMSNKILENCGAKPVEFFYLGVRSDVLPMRYGKFYSYFRNPVRGLTTVIENYFSLSPYKSVLGYTKSKESIIPIFKEENVLDKEKDILEQNLKATSLFANIIKEHCDVIGIEEPLANIANYTTEILINISAKIRLDSFLEVGSFDSPLNKEISFSKKLNIGELFSYSILGNNITAYDKVSVEATVGKKLGKKLNNIHDNINVIKFAILKRMR